MANQKHLDILARGVEAWNAWRAAYPAIWPDLSGADLSRANLSGADLSRANLSGADLNGANLSEADLGGTDLAAADLIGAELIKVNLSEANLSEANLSEADLSGADLSGANLSGATLIEANLVGTSLVGAYLYIAHLYKADLSRAWIGFTIFANTDLSEVNGLKEVVHQGPSTIAIDTLYRSAGRIPEVFLRGCGVPDSFIDYIPALVGSLQPIQFYSCFISYSAVDEALAKRLHADLQANHVRVWFAPEDLKIGDRLRPRIDESIRVYDKLLLLLSEHSLASQWVEQEVETALAKERAGSRTMLFPIRLDDAVMGIKDGWPALIRNTRHIGDFRRWKRHDAYQKAFARLLRNLRAAEKTTES